MPPRGGVSSTAETASSRVRGSALSASRAARRWAARSPRLLPSATKTRSGLDGKVTRDPLEIRGQIAQLPDGALQLGLPRRRLSGPAGQSVGIGPALGRAGGDLFDLGSE